MSGPFPNTAIKIIQAWAQHQKHLDVNNGKDLAQICVHSILVACGFRLVPMDEGMESTLTLPDPENLHFRPLPSQFLASDQFKYRHSQSALTFLIKYVEFKDQLVILGGAEETSQIHILKISIPEHFAISQLPCNLAQMQIHAIFGLLLHLRQFFTDIHVGIIKKLIPDIKDISISTIEEPPRSSTRSLPPSAARPPQPPQPEIIYERQPGGFYRPPENPFSIGERDLDPFGSIRPPTSSGGMIVGPEHPYFDSHLPDTVSNNRMFRRPFQDDQPHYPEGPGVLPPGAVPPGARFDPIMPFNPLPGPPRPPQSGRNNQFRSGEPVGGIYTVIRSKVPVTVDEYGSRYFLIGPVSKSSHLEVEECEPAHPNIATAIENMRKSGIRVVYGKWLVEHAPFVLLFDIGSAFHRCSEWKGDLWDKAKIPSPGNDQEMNDAIVFGYLVAWFLGEFSHLNTKNAIIAHFHEWMASVGLVLAKIRSIDICTIFTTHATLLGRYLCAGSVDFYNSLHKFDVDYEAGKRGIYHRYCVERAATHCADVFTTVSHITAYEAENLLKRKPDGVLPNGLNVVKFSAMHEFQNLHALFKSKINEFVRGHFYNFYNFDLDNTLYFFTSGRYEYRNKGVDMFLEALSRVNQRLKYLTSPITVVGFIIMPAPNNSFTVDTLKGQAVMKQLRETVSQVQESIGKKIFENCSRGVVPKASELVTEDDLILLKRRIYSLKRDTLPPVVTHNMVDDQNDPILNQIRRLGMYNNPEDRVKIIFHPEFLNSNNPLFGLDYDDFVRGCHLGVFPSYYEPWGYTPAECTVMGIPSITTNLSGFGSFMEENIENPSDYGIYIIDRRMKSVEESIQQLADQMLHFCQKSRRQRINQRNRTERLSDILDWRRMGLEYVKARHLAMRRKYPEAFDELSDEGGYTTGDTERYETDQLETPIEEENTGVISPLEEGRKIRKPFSAPSSPKMRAMMKTKEENMNDLKTVSSVADGLDHMAVSEKLTELKISGSKNKKN